jgi:hypothetical protein
MGIKGLAKLLSDEAPDVSVFDVQDIGTEGPHRDTVIAFD